MITRLAVNQLAGMRPMVARPMVAPDMCGHDPYPRVARSVSVRSSREIAPSVFELVIDANAAQGAQGAPDRGQAASRAIPRPVSGQFFMLRARPSAVFLGRPISVYLADNNSITFLILKKGAGSAELCALRAGDSLDLVGPIGNRFVPPAELGGEHAGVATGAQSGVPAGARTRPRVAIIGGGIGVAPVAGFALGLPDKSFDFYASFRSSPYGLDGIESCASRLVVTTEDGSSGVKGMLPAVFDASKYDLVYACGPTPMLRYVKEACDAAAAGAAADSAPAGTVGAAGQRGPRAFLSLEEHMACGAGACLGCTVRTVNGNRRCCVDGPVFEASEVLL